MTQKIVYFFPHNPYPPRSGAHKRCLEMLAGLRKLGCDVILLSSSLSSETPWNVESIKQLEAEFVTQVCVYEPSYLDRISSAFLYRFHRYTPIKLPLDSYAYTPIGMRWWFADRIQDIVPDVIVMNYCFWDGLLNHLPLPSTLKIIDTIDLFTVNNQMREALVPYLPAAPIHLDAIDDVMLQPDFFEKLDLETSPEEFQVFDRYDHTIAIAKNEFEIIRKNTTNTTVSLLPMTQDPCYLDNQYTDSPIFTTGPNPFNTQGYLYFAKLVLPKVLAKIPAFQLQVTGACCQEVAPTIGIELAGFVPDLKSLYRQAKFLICPVFGGTGQQVKIVEAMAHGLPVVALQSAAKKSPIEHGINGFIASDAEEFADYVIQLWQDPELCRQLGTAARTKIANDFSETFLLNGLSALLRSSRING
jgi:glycosyltransferase involved in cell wall biosynthesis